MKQSVRKPFKQLNWLAFFTIAYGVAIFLMPSCGDPKGTDEPIPDTSIQTESLLEKNAEPTTPLDASSEKAPDTASPQDTQPDTPAPKDEPQEQSAPDEEPDIPTVGEVANPEKQGKCNGAAAKEWPLNNAVSTGVVKIEDQGPPMRITIDASAGGSMNARTNPFIYLDLKTGKKVEITDLQALNDSTWDLAFKRVVIRSNSEDSGPGQREVARLTDTDLSKVTTAPADNTFKTDIYLDNTCKAITDPIGTPVTAFNLLNPDNPSGSESWYSYGGASGISPVSGHVYVIRRKQTGEAFKLQIISWNSGVFTITWQSL